MNEQIRVAMIGDFPLSPTEVRGGVESVMLYLCRELVRGRQVDLNVVTMDRWGLGARELSFDGFRVHYLSRSKLPSLAGRSANIRSMKETLVSLQPDLVHAHIAGYYSDAARLCGLPWILTLHGIRFLEARLSRGLVNRTFRRWMITREERRGVRSAPALISINPFVEDCFNDQIRCRVLDIENPVDDQFFQLKQINEPFRILHVGRLTPRKDLMTLLEAFRLLLETAPEAQLWLAGAPDETGDYLQRLQSFVSAHRLTEKVRFLGLTRQRDLLSLYERASVVVLSAVLETAPMAIAESLAAATAVVTTDAGGCRHLVRDGRDGRVVPSGHSSALASALAQVLGSDGRALEAGALGRENAEQRFRARRVAETTVQAYRTLLSGQLS